MDNYRTGFYIEVNVAGVDEIDAGNRASGLLAMAVDEEIQLALRTVKPLYSRKEEHDTETGSPGVRREVHPQRG